MLDFLRDYLAPSGIHVCAITPDPFDGSGIDGRSFGSDWQAASAWCAEENAKGRNLYFSVNGVRPGLNKKPHKTDITLVRFAHVDIDPPKNNPSWDKQAALADLIARGAPSVVIDSGNGWQALWWLNESTDVETIEQINRGIVDRFQADHCWNVDRLLRIPGTINYPDKKKQSLGRVPVQATLAVPFNGNIYAPSALVTAFPASSAVEVAEALPDGPCVGYTGPANDEELIKLMMASRGGIAAMFGDKATLADLWSGDVTLLAKFFPSDSGDDFNRSEAEMALLTHFSFYTGKDASRMDRLFRKSGLMRDKWERGSYRVPSIQKAIRIGTSFYNVVREPVATATTVATLPGLPGTAVLDGEIMPAGEMLLIPDQVEHFRGCVYVMNDHKILLPNGEFAKPDQFKAMYGGHVFVMSGDMTGPTKNAFEAFTENRAHRFPKVNKSAFNPRNPFGHIENETVNTYFPDPTVISTPGDVMPMLLHVAKLWPDQRDQEIFWTYTAALVQNPGIKFQWALFIQGVEGNGKTILSDMVKFAVGLRYYHKPFADDVTNKFNDFMVRKLFIDLQEITLEDRAAVFENLKEWITSSWIEVQPKGGAKTMVENYANWMLTSNHKAAIPITANQRRISPLFCAQQDVADVTRDFPPNYFPTLWDWCRDGGFAALTHYLQNRPLDPDLNPAGRGLGAARAPDTSSTAEAIGASMGNYEQEVVEAIAEGVQGFRGGWISSVALESLAERRKLRITRPRRKMALETLGYVEFGRSPVMVMSEGAVRPVLYFKKAMRDTGLTVQDYLEKQGFTY